MRYRAYEHKHVPGQINDVFDSCCYKNLKGKPVQVNGKDLSHTFFSDPRDIALGLSTDGFAPFRRRKNTAWPLLLFNYNLPPEIRFHMKNTLCLGVIPGPKKPKDFDSFLWPFAMEMLKLALGVPAFDKCSSSLFALHAYLLLVFGDMPAIAMAMRMKGHNGIRPCRMCSIVGLRAPNNPRATTHYVPLNRANHPAVTNSHTSIKTYNGSQLPLRTHTEFIDQAYQVQCASTNDAEERLAKEYGIKGVPILACLSSLSFPASFPFDFMHLIWENVVKNLILLWTGEFKGLDEGTGLFKLAPKVWEAIGRAGAVSGDSIPHAFGARPPDIATAKSSSTADTWSFWTLYLGPVLLRRQFADEKYYHHFIDLVKLLNLCLQFEISMEEIKLIRDGMVKWVNQYET
jgi:hypothetical protein